MTADAQTLATVVGVLLLATAISNFASAHGGGLDAYGCHHDRKAGGYHCHQGPMAGQSFSSQAEMLKQLEQKAGKPSGNAPDRR